MCLFCALIWTQQISHVNSCCHCNLNATIVISTEDSRKNLQLIIVNIELQVVSGGSFKNICLLVYNRTLSLIFTIFFQSWLLITQNQNQIDANRQLLGVLCSIVVAHDILYWHSTKLLIVTCLSHSKVVNIGPVWPCVIAPHLRHVGGDLLLLCQQVLHRAESALPVILKCLH